MGVLIVESIEFSVVNGVDVIYVDIWFLMGDEMLFEVIKEKFMFY